MQINKQLFVSSVSALKEAIYDKTRIPEDKQVLLINGGEALAPSSRVCAHSAAGTDTSPIFLFNKCAIEQQTPPAALTDYGADPDLKERVDACLNMQPTFNTVVARTELAKQIYELSTQQVRVCEKLVHDQHLQHQGWQAVVANLDDVVSVFKGSWHQLESNITQFLHQKTSNEELLKSFHDTLDVLDKLPLIPELLQSSLTFSRSGTLSSTDSTLTLFDWINQKDHQKNLSEVAEVCLQALNRFDPSFLDDLKKEVEDLLSQAKNNDMKEIKGLGERLYGLDELMAEARKLSAEQQELSNSLYRNQQRFSNYQDQSLLPDLCKSHRMSLEVMMKNHQQLRDIRRRCIQAKKELSDNLHQRLRWIVYIEKRVADIDEKILVHRENIRRLRLHLEIVQQIHLAPKLYVFAVREVVRRRLFSKSFKEWSSTISEDSSNIYREESRRRKEVMSLINNHFLATLFPGITDFLPAFALEPLPAFDASLPALEEKHVELLREKVPQLFDKISLEDAVPHHYQILSRYFVTQSSSDIKRLSEFLIDINGEVYINQAHISKKISYLISDMRCIREVFKTLQQTSQAISNETKSQFNEISTQLIERINEDLITSHKKSEQLETNLDSVVKEVNQLKDTVTESQNALESLKGELEEKTEELNSYKTEADGKVSLLESQLNKVKMEILDRELELDGSRKLCEDKDKIIKAARDEIRVLESRLSTRDKEVQESKSQLAQENRLLKKEIDRMKHDIQKQENTLRASFEAEKTAALKNQREQMTINHKSEIELMKSRFKLASNIEKAQDSLEPAVDYTSILSENASLTEEVKELKKKHAAEVDRLKKEHEDELQAVKQVSFNESINRVAKDKEVIIQELKKEIELLKIQAEPVRCSTPTLDSPAYQALDANGKVNRLEIIIREKDTRIAKLQDTLAQSSEKAAIMR